MSRSGRQLPGAGSMVRRGSTSSRGSAASSRSTRPFTAPPPPPKRIDRLVSQASFEAFWPEPESDEGSAERVWQVENFTAEQVRELVPHIEVPEPPKAARDAYWFFDRDKRPTLDNEKLFAEARKDRSRPKLSTMQVRAIDALWDACDADERAMYEELAEQDKQRYDGEMAATAKARADMQVQAANVELTQWLQTIGLQQYDQQLKASGLKSIKEMRDALHNGRWTFLGKLEDAGLTNELHQQNLRNALNRIVVAKPRPKTVEKTPAQLARERKRAAQDEARKQAELAQQLKAEAAEMAADKKRRAEEKVAAEKAKAKARLLLDHYGMPCDPEMAEVIVSSRRGQGVLEGQDEYLVRWEMGAGKTNEHGDPIDRSWVPEELLLSSPSSSQLLQHFHEQQRQKNSATGPLAVVAYDPDFSQMDFGARFKDRKQVVLRKKTKIVSDEALRSWDSYRAHLQLPKNAPGGLKPRDFLRVHRGLDNHGDGLVRMQDVREMLARLGLKLSVLEATEVLWEADDDHTGALDVQDLVELYFRVTTDATGYEPRRLFCMLEFLLFSAPSEDAQSTKAERELTVEEKEEQRAMAYTLEAEEATRMVRNRYGGRDAVPYSVNAYLERSESAPAKLTQTRQRPTAVGFLSAELHAQRIVI